LYTYFFGEKSMAKKTYRRGCEVHTWSDNPSFFPGVKLEHVINTEGIIFDTTIGQGFGKIREEAKNKAEQNKKK
jgi:hypothetical protein